MFWISIFTHTFRDKGKGRRGGWQRGGSSQNVCRTFYWSVWKELKETHTLFSLASCQPQRKRERERERERMHFLSFLPICLILQHAAGNQSQKGPFYVFFFLRKKKKCFLLKKYFKSLQKRKEKKKHIWYLLLVQIKNKYILKNIILAYTRGVSTILNWNKKTLINIIANCINVNPNVY